MNLRTLLWACACGFSALPVHAASLSEAFEQGSTFGRSGNAAARSHITTTPPASTVPQFTATPTQSTYFGSTDLGGNASALQSACLVTPSAGSPSAQACAAINFTRENPARRPTFNITPTDPLLVRGKQITADPQSIVGNLAGTYTGCTTRSITTPDIFDKHFCNEYRVLERLTCEKTLSVEVRDDGLGCAPNTLITPNPRIAFIRPYVYVGAVCADEIRFQWTYGYSECNGTNASIVVMTTVPSEHPQRMLVNLGCGGTYFLEGACPDGVCNYRVGTEAHCDDPCPHGCCDGYLPEQTLATFSFTRPQRTYTLTDTWINQCAPYEARLP